MQFYKLIFFLPHIRVLLVSPTTAMQAQLQCFLVMGGDEIAKPECVREEPWRSHEQRRVEAKHISLTTRARGRKRSVDTKIRTHIQLRKVY